jgi:hypothetical protein
MFEIWGTAGSLGEKAGATAVYNMIYGHDGHGREHQHLMLELSVWTERTWGRAVLAAPARPGPLGRGERTPEGRLLAITRELMGHG